MTTGTPPAKKPKVIKRKAPDEPRGANAPVLDDETRAEIVMRLAMYETATDIVDWLADQGIVVSRQAVAAYDPEKCTRNLASKWRTLFYETREKWRAELIEVPIANRITRLRRMDQLYRMAKDKGDVETAAKLIEQAAKEVGNVFTNVTKTKGEVQHNHTHEVTTDEKRNMLADRLKEGLARLPRPASAH